MHKNKQWLEQILVERVKWAQLIKLMHRLLKMLREKLIEWHCMNQWKEWATSDLDYLD